MTVAFSATLIDEARLGPDLKVAAYVVQLSEVWALAGVACDLSAEFDYVYGAVFGCSGAIGDHAMFYDLIGTKVTAAGKGGGGIAADGVSIVAHRDAATEGAFPGVPNSTDLKGVNDLTMLVFGA